MIFKILFKALLIVAFSFIISSCNKTESNCIKSVITELEFEIDTIKFNVNSNQYNYSLIKSYYNDSVNWIMGLDENNNSIDVFDLDTKVFITRIEIPVERQFENIQISDFEVVNKDSIYIFSEINQKLVLTDLKNEIKWQSIINLDSINKRETKILGIDSFTGYMKYWPTSKCIVFPATPLKDLEEKGFFEQEMLLAYYIDSKELKSFGQYPKHYSNDSKVSPVSNFIYLVVIDDNLLTSFSGSPDIQFYGAQLKLEKSYCINSSFVTKIETINRDFDIQEASNYMRSNGFFLSFHYEPSSNYIFRIVKHSQDLRKPDGKINNYFASPFSILYSDPSFENVKEFKLPKEVYKFTNVLTSKHGILISAENELNPNNDEEILEFHLYKTH